MSDYMNIKDNSGFGRNRRLYFVMENVESGKPRFLLTQEGNGSIELTKEDTVELSAGLMALMLIFSTLEAVREVDAKVTAEEIMKKMKEGKK